MGFGREQDAIKQLLRTKHAEKFLGDVPSHTRKERSSDKICRASTLVYKSTSRSLAGIWLRYESSLSSTSLGRAFTAATLPLGVSIYAKDIQAKSKLDSLCGEGDNREGVGFSKQFKRGMMEFETVASADSLADLGTKTLRVG